jgi:hypothetical protein
MSGFIVYAERHGSPTAAGNRRWLRIQRSKNPVHENCNAGRRFECIRWLGLLAVVIVFMAEVNEVAQMLRRLRKRQCDDLLIDVRRG